MMAGEERVIVVKLKSNITNCAVCHTIETHLTSAAHLLSVRIHTVVLTAFLKISEIKFCQLLILY